MVAVFDRHSSHRSRVGAGGRLAEAKAAEDFALGERLEILLLLFFSSELLQGPAYERVLHCHGDAG